MKKQIIITVIIALLVGIIGFVGGWYKFIKAPELKAQKEVKAQQEQMEQMTRHGEVKEVTENTITIDIDKSGSKETGKQKYRGNEYTSIQIGMQFANQPGELLDLTQWFKKGDYVNMLVKDQQAVLIHRDLRNGEQPLIEDETINESTDEVGDTN